MTGTAAAAATTTTLLLLISVFLPVVSASASASASPVITLIGRTATINATAPASSPAPLLRGKEGVGRTGNYVDLAICIASFLGSLTIILPYLLNRAHRKLRHALILGLATSDLMSSLVIIVSTSYLVTHDHRDHADDRSGSGFDGAPAFCSILGFLIASSIFTQHLWNLSIATVTYAILVYPLATFTITVERRIKWLWPLFWIVAALMHAIIWGVIGYTDIGGYCQIAPTHGRLTAPLIQFVPRALVVFTTIALYAHLFLFLRRTNLFSKAHRSGASSSKFRISASNHRTGDRAGGVGVGSRASNAAAAAAALFTSSSRNNNNNNNGGGGINSIPSGQDGSSSENAGQLLSHHQQQSQGLFSALNSHRGSVTDQGSVATARRPSHLTVTSTTNDASVHDGSSPHETAKTQSPHHHAAPPKTLILDPNTAVLIDSARCRASGETAQTGTLSHNGGESGSAMTKASKMTSYSRRGSSASGLIIHPLQSHPATDEQQQQQQDHQQPLRNRRKKVGEWFVKKLNGLFPQPFDDLPPDVEMTPQPSSHPQANGRSISPLATATEAAAAAAALAANAAGSRSVSVSAQGSTAIGFADSRRPSGPNGAGSQHHSILTPLTGSTALPAMSPDSRSSPSTAISISGSDGGKNSSSPRSAVAQPLFSSFFSVAGPGGRRRNSSPSAATSVPLQTMGGGGSGSGMRPSTSGSVGTAGSEIGGTFAATAPPPPAGVSLGPNGFSSRPSTAKLTPVVEMERSLSVPTLASSPILARFDNAPSPPPAVGAVSVRDTVSTSQGGKSARPHSASSAMGGGDESNGSASADPLRPSPRGGALRRTRSYGVPNSRPAGGDGGSEGSLSSTSLKEEEEEEGLMEVSTPPMPGGVMAVSSSSSSSNLFERRRRRRREQDASLSPRSVNTALTATTNRSSSGGGIIGPSSPISPHQQANQHGYFSSPFAPSSSSQDFQGPQPALRALSLGAGLVAQRVPRPRSSGKEHHHHHYQGVSHGKSQVSSPPVTALGGTAAAADSNDPNLDIEKCGPSHLSGATKTGCASEEEEEETSDADSILELRATMPPRKDAVDFQMNSPPQEHLSHFMAGVVSVRGSGVQAWKSRISRAVSTGAMGGGGGGASASVSASAAAAAGANALVPGGLSSPGLYGNVSSSPMTAGSGPSGGGGGASSGPSTAPLWGLASGGWSGFTGPDGRLHTAPAGAQHGGGGGGGGSSHRRGSSPATGSPRIGGPSSSHSNGGSTYSGPLSAPLGTKQSASYLSNGHHGTGSGSVTPTIIASPKTTAPIAIVPTIAANTVEVNRQRRRKASEAAKRRVAVGLDVEEDIIKDHHQSGQTASGGGGGSAAATLGGGGGKLSGFGAKLLQHQQAVQQAAQLQAQQQQHQAQLHGARKSSVLGGSSGVGTTSRGSEENGLSVMEQFEAAMGNFEWGMDVTQLNGPAPPRYSTAGSGIGTPSMDGGGAYHGGGGKNARSWTGRMSGYRRHSDADHIHHHHSHGKGKGNTNFTTSAQSSNSMQSGGQHGVESLGSTLNRQASILMLLYPTAYVLLFSVSIIRIVVDLADPVPVGGMEARSQRALHSVARWFIFAQGLFDAIIFQLVERHFRSRMKRRRKEALGEPVPLTAWQMLTIWTKTLVFGHGPRR